MIAKDKMAKFLDELKEEECHTAFYPRKEMIKKKLLSLEEYSDEYNSIVAAVEFLSWKRIK